MVVLVLFVGIFILVKGWVDVIGLFGGFDDMVMLEEMGFKFIFG